jgi:curli production assembly/transport component CsgF
VIATKASTQNRLRGAKALSFAGTILCLAYASSFSAIAGDLTYQPINPAFGGSPNNTSFLYQGAEASNNFKRKNERREKLLSEANSPFKSNGIEDFSKTLQSRLLAGLADQITTAIYGDNPQGAGTYVVNGTTVTFNTIGNVVYLTVSDGVSTTNIALPKK